MSSTPGELLKKALLIVEQDLKHITTLVMG